VTLSSSRLRPAFLGLLLPPPAISSSVYPSSSFVIFPPAALSSYVSALPSYQHDPAPNPLCFDMLHYMYCCACIASLVLYLFFFAILRQVRLGQVGLWGAVFSTAEVLVAIACLSQVRATQDIPGNLEGVYLRSSLISQL
jgi:hypothetical protein